MGLLELHREPWVAQSMLDQKVQGESAHKCWEEKREGARSREPGDTPPSPTEQWAQETKGLVPGLHLDTGMFVSILRCKSLEENVVSGCPCAPSTCLRAKY